MSILLGVNIDHIATIRQARGVDYPSPVEAAMICEKSGADSITLHLREDRRHIQEQDARTLKQILKKRMNLEMAATEEMIRFAQEIKPSDCCLVPEKREELTTEGGLDVFSQKERIKEVCSALKDSNVRVSLFIDPQEKQIDAALECGAPVIEIHTGHYANFSGDAQIQELDKIAKMVTYANSLGLQVNAGHGLTLENTIPIAKLPEIVELNIGHSIVSRAIFVGLSEATFEMKNLMLEARL